MAAAARSEAILSGVERILFLGSYCPEVAGKNPAFSVAADSFQANLLKGLLQQGVSGIQVVSVCPATHFPPGSTLYVRGQVSQPLPSLLVHQVSFVNLIGIKPFWQLFAIAWESLKLLRRGAFRPDVVLTYNALQRWALPAILTAKILRIPAVCLAADVQSIDQDVTLCRSVLHRMRAFWLKRFDGVIVLSSLIAHDFLRPSQAWMRMEGAILPGEYVQPGEGSDRALLFYGGSLGEWGGIRLLLQAFALLPSEYRLWISGNGPLEGEVIRAAAGNPRIRFLGLVDRRDYLRILGQAGILINPRPPSLPENRYNFPSKLLEYLATGRPVVSTLTADLAEEYGDFIFACDEENPEALARAILSVSLTDPRVRQQKSLRAREFVLTSKSWEAQSSRVHGFLCRLLIDTHRVLGQQPP